LFQILLADPRVHLIVDDGRQYLMANQAPFDAVFLDPLRTATAYSNNLYSREFFQLVANHLSPSGVLMLWQDEFDILPRTVASVFQRVRYYSYFLLASKAQFAEHPERRAQIRSGFDPAMQHELENFPLQLAAEEASDQLRIDLDRINTDWKPRTEYYLGWSTRRALAGATPPHFPEGARR
jgi:spermidine synthase